MKKLANRNYFFRDTGSRWVPPRANLLAVKGLDVYPWIGDSAECGSLSWGRNGTPFDEEFGGRDGWKWRLRSVECFASTLPAIHLSAFHSLSDFTRQALGGVGIRIDGSAALRLRATHGIGDRLSFLQNSILQNLSRALSLPFRPHRKRRNITSASIACSENVA